MAGEEKPLNIISILLTRKTSINTRIITAVSPIGKGSKAQSMTPALTKLVINFASCEKLSDKLKYNIKNITVAKSKIIDVFKGLKIKLLFVFTQFPSLPNFAIFKCFVIYKPF